jgi:putative ABC transport system substrate-binding protein
MRRRDVLTIVGGAAAATWPFAAATQSPKLPVVGILGIAPRRGVLRPLPDLRQGLQEFDYVEGKTVMFEYRQADGHPDRLSALAQDLVRHQVRVIVTNGGSASALAAKAATSSIPIVFTTGDDPVHVGLVASLRRPSGNVTGVSIASTELVAKRLELLRELVPRAEKIALLMPPNAIEFTKEQTTSVVRASGLDVVVVEGSPDRFEQAFASATEQHADALLVAAAPTFLGRRAQIVALASQHALPAVYPFREFCEAGGLMSYGPNPAEAYYLAGQYAGRILRGAAPSELPVQLPAKIELVINLRTIKALGLRVSRLLNVRADKVIE